jgi:hypothetical protein
VNKNIAERHPNRAILARPQYSAVAGYSGLFIVVSYIMMNIFANLLGILGLERVAVAGLSVPIGAFLGWHLYNRNSRVIMEYGRDGFTVKKGRKILYESDWKKFKAVSIFVDNTTRPSLRLYYERDGDHVDIPTHACGGDPFALREYAQKQMRQ